MSKSVSSLQDGNEYYYTFLASNATTQVWSPVNKSFTTIARPVVVTFEDDTPGGPIMPGTVVTYTITFSTTMDGNTIQTTDFGNGAATTPATVTINSVNTVGAEVTVVVTPTTEGNLQLQINQAAVIADADGVKMDTTSAYPDDTTISVSFEGSVFRFR